MKFYLKNYLKVGILFFGISLIITNCQEEDVRPTETQKIEQPPANISINYVQGESIPNIVSLLDPSYSSYSKSDGSKSSTLASPFGSISIENILEVIDTLGNQNYSFSLIPITPKPNSIFNLVVGKSNEATDMAIVEYRMSPDFAEAYYNGTKSMGEFTGSIITFPFNAVASNIFSKSSGNTCVQNIDEVVNCDQINVDNGTVVSSGGSGNTGTTGIGGTGTYTGGTGGDVTQDYGGGSASWVCSCNETHASPSECNCTNTSGGAGSRGARGAWIITLPDSHTSKSSDTKGKSSTTSCCDGANLDGSLGINAYRTELANSISLILKLLNTSEEAIWLANNATVGQLTSLRDFLASNKGSVEAKGFAKAQIAIEILTDPKKIKLEPKNGKLNNRDDQEYTHFGSNGTYNVYQLKDGSRVLKSPWPLKINTDGQLINDTGNQDTGESWYIKPAGESFWSNYLLKESVNLSEELRKTALLTGTALAKAIGTYVLPVEDIKILITGSDFDGQQVSRYQAAGFLLLTIVPGSKALKIVGNAADAVTVVVKLGSNNLVVDTVKTGLKIVTDNNIVKFLSQTGDEIARIVNGVMTFKYAGFGGNIVTKTNKTTTLLGRYADNTGDGTKAVLDSKLFKFGENKGGFNLLDESTWNNLTQSQRDLLNYNWLEQAFMRGDDIRLISDQSNKFHNGILTQYGKELNWIENFKNTYNYSYNSTTKTHIKN